MQFRTEISLPTSLWRLSYGSHILSVGSCFADRTGERLARRKFDAVVNPMGVMFNPCSVADTIERFADRLTIDDNDLFFDGELYRSYLFHGSFAGVEMRTVVEKMNQAVERGAEAFDRADCLLVTLGTATVYRLVETGVVVANCHKQPQSLFSKSTLDVEQIATRLTELFGRFKAKHIILSVSPVRHLSDGFEQNSLSKALLRVAAAKVVAQCDNVDYFPAFEIVTDDLRDYRFYADDLVHPSERAVDYVWEKFEDSFFDPATKQFAARIEQIVNASLHRPLHPQADSYRRFCATMLQRIDALERDLPSVDFGSERALFASGAFGSDKQVFSG